MEDQSTNDRILLVDDDTMVLELNELILTKLGYQVISNSNSLEALELFKDLPHHFSLVITDYKMPHLNGEQLSREILKINPQIPIIICSGFTSEFSSDDAKALGIKWFVRKPLLKKDFALLIEKALSNQDN
nr:response regulator [Desulfobulbaceae bacterium]